MSLSETEIAKRRESLDQNIEIFKSQGYEITSELLADMETWARGEISDEEHIKYLEKKYKPKG